MSERRIVIRHILRNGIIPIITLAGIEISMLLGGSILVETVFNILGMGRLAVNGVLSLDYAVVQAVVLCMAIMVVSVNFIIDISYGWIDPRIRLS
jgi:peptide/nickel transport system permease protein